MTDPNFIILYVADPLASAAFYERLLGRAPVDAAPTFAMFALGSGVMLGLWARHGVQPAVPAGAACAAELAFSVDSVAAVEQRFAQWQAAGLTMVQSPTSMDFGHTFTAVDPDGHRLRVFTPTAA